MKKYLVIGANGLLGRYLIKLLSKRNIVYAVSRNRAGTCKPNVHSLEMDLDKGWDEKILPADLDCVFLLAQSNHHRDAYEFSSDVFNVNLQSAFRIIDFYSKRKIRKIVVASSGGVYSLSSRPISEKAQLTPTPDIYIASKMCLENIVNAYRKHTDISILRPFFIYGPSQKSNFLIPRLVESVRSGKEIILQGKSGIRINPIYVEDAAKAFAKEAVLRGSNDINIAGMETVSIKKISEIIGQVLKKDPVFRIQGNASRKHLVADITLMRKLLVTPTISLQIGITQYLAYEKN
ncbi:MAG: NAD(P)-dependent oxidoreductase [Patescibacteria group bacterium]